MRSIVLHIYEDQGLEARLQAAFDLARAFGGHLTCLHATPYEDYLTADPILAAALPVEFSKKMRRLGDELRTRIEGRLAAEGVSWDWVHRNESISAALIRFSMLADVVVISLGEGPALERRDVRPVAAKVATQGCAPVLVIPQGLARLRLDAPMMIAWNGSAESAAAMRGALPMLKSAPSVHVIEIEGGETAYPRDEAARYLSRHDIHAKIIQHPRGDGEVGAAIREAARELGVGLIVMGAYGRPRLLELAIGGVTRSMLDESTLPLLLAH